MHMSDALLSAPVAVAADVAAAGLLVAASLRIKKNASDNVVALMGVMGAFVFAAQMVNFSVPGTGSSGHIVGGVLLGALLGPWAGFLTLTSVLIIQCLIFADGGLMALGCNVLNMAAMTALVAYPLVMRPLLRYPAASWKVMAVSVLACVVGLELGACMVTVETVASHITALPPARFFLLMTGIHLAIGVIEGLATGTVLLFVQRSRPELLQPDAIRRDTRRNVRGAVIGFAVAAVVIAGGLAFLASGDPDGLEWSVERVAGTSELEAEHVGVLSQAAEAAQQSTVVMPDYEGSLAGIAGTVMVLILVWVLSSLLVRSRRRQKERI